MLRIGCGLDNLKWHKVRLMIRYIFLNSEIKVTSCHNRIINPDQDRIKDIIKKYHVTPTGGHQGICRTCRKIKIKYK